MRAIDLQLLALTIAAGALAAGLSRMISRPRRPIGPIVVAAGLALAVAADHMTLQTVNRHITGTWVGRVGVVVVALLAARGGARLTRATISRLPIVVVLTGISLIGVWAGVPETSQALVAVGVVAGVGGVMILGGVALSTGAAATMGALPALAAGLGAAGNAHAVAGGLLCSTTLVVLALARSRISPSAGRVLVAVLLHACSAGIAARHVAINRSWGDVWAPSATAVGLGLLAALAVRQPGSAE